MSEYTPDRWVVLKIVSEKQETYKVLAGWGGSYTHGASWKLNSGITEVKEDGDYFLFSGYSGSVYKCHKQGYGLTGLTAQVLESFYKDLEEQPVTLTCLNEDETNFMELKYV